MSQQRHGVPALLSLVLPGLGQLVKGQWERALVVWAVILAPCIIVAAQAVVENSAYAAPDIADLPGIVMRLPLFPVVVVITAAAWLWSVVDAYRHAER